MNITLINLSKTLYELKQKNAFIEANNATLEAKVAENEETITTTMLACAELYEMLVTLSNVYSYGKDGVVKMASAMVMVYVNLVKRGLKDINDVPENLREEVKAVLETEE